MKKQNFSIVSIDPYKNLAYIYEKNLLRSFSLKKSKRNFYISFLNSKDFIPTRLSLSKTIDEHELKEIIEFKVYEELDLDHAKEYQIGYEELPTLPTDKERLFNVFVTEKEIIEPLFEQIVSLTGYIDVITATPLLFKTLYTNDILNGKGVDLFIYFQENDAFLTIYKDGYYLYSKSLKYSFADIAERLSELLKRDVSAYEVMEDLKNEGLRITDLEKLQHYMQIFSELFMHINDVLIYTKRANNIESIDHIYISSSIGSIQGIEEYCQIYLAQVAFDFIFDYGIESKEQFVEDLHYMAILAAQDVALKGISYPNFTIYPRPLPFFKRPTGELILLISAAIILGLSYPLYNYTLGYKYQIELRSLQKEYPSLHAKRVALEKQINQLKRSIADVKKKKEIKEKEIDRAMKVLKAIYQKKVEYKMKSETLADISQDLVRYQLLLRSIDINESDYKFHVTATDDKSITRFINFIAEEKSDRYAIKTKDINKTNNIYTSTLEVRVR